MNNKLLVGAFIVLIGSAAVTALRVAKGNKEVLDELRDEETTEE